MRGENVLQQRYLYVIVVIRYGVARGWREEGAS